MRASGRTIFRISLGVMSSTISVLLMVSLVDENRRPSTGKSPRPGMRVALLVVGTGLTGSIYVVCAPMLGEFTPVSQRGAMLAIYGAIYTLAGVAAPIVMGSMEQRAATPREGYISGFVINAVILIVAGLLGLLLLWPGTEKARLSRAAISPKSA